MTCATRWLVTAVLCIACAVPSAASGAEEKRSLAWQTGPGEVRLGDQAVLSLPKGYRSLGPDDTQYVLKEMGNFPSGTELGLIAPANDEESWFVVVQYIDTGYIKDTDAEHWDADALMTSIKEGTEEDNKQRKNEGSAALLIRGWEEKPTYDKTSHKVVWSISHTVEGEQGVGVNYNTVALGRHGYMSMNLVGDLNDLPRLTPHAQTLLTHLNFVEGKRYADFNSATDKVAAVGLAALIAGVAVKTGLLAKLWAFILPIALVAKKFIVLMIIGGAALLGKLWKKMRSAPTQA